MTRLNKMGRDAARDLDVHAATDITGFSLMGHSLEMATASSVTIEIDSSLVPLIPEAEELARFGFLPEGMYNNLDWISGKVQFAPYLRQSIKDLMTDPQTSGGLLLSLPFPDAEKVVERIGKPYCAIIGRVKEKGDFGVELK